MKLAYMILAHHRFDVLKQLLQDLDHPDNDIFLHVDKRVTSFPRAEVEQSVTRARLTFIKRRAVFWGNYSQIQADMDLLKAALDAGTHDYYMMLTGVDFPLMTQTQIRDFLSTNSGREFVGFFRENREYEERMRYYYCFGKYDRIETKTGSRLRRLNRKLLEWQKKHEINRIKHEDGYYQKGYANWRVTRELAEYIYQEYLRVKGEYRFTTCADEILVQTIVYHSPFYEKIWDEEDEYGSAMQYNTWSNPGQRVIKEQLEDMMKSGRMFARKFEGEDAMELIGEICKRR